MGKSTYAAFRNDENREKSGVTLDLGEAGRFKIARAGGANSAFQRRLMALSKPHRRAIQTGTIDPKVADSILQTAYAETVLLGWEGVTDENGNEMTFTKDNAVKLFTDLPELFAEIRQTAEDSALFRAELAEGDAGN